MLYSVIKKIRLIMDLSAEDFSASLGISTSYLYAIESGRSLPRLEVLEQFSTVTGVSVSKIFYLSERADLMQGTPALQAEFQRVLVHEIDKVLNPQYYSTVQ